MSDVNIRQLVLESLIEIIENDQFSNQVKNQVLEKYAYLERRDRAFYAYLVEGTLGSLLALDFYIDQVSKTPVKKQKPLIRNLLRMSTYQILYMDSIPDSAAINEAVKLAKKRGFTQLSGFVNGVLRNLSRQKDCLKQPEDLSTKYSVPQWMVDSFVDDYGKEKTIEILENLNLPQKLSIRVNTAKTTKEELIKALEKEAKENSISLEVTPIEGTKDGLFLSGVDRLTEITSFVEGKFYIQDASSMMVAEAAMVQENDYCIDVCAAPGGKSTHIAQLLNGTGFVDARDLTDYKVSLIEDNIDRLQLTNISAKVWDATIRDESVVGKADVLICDAPCSGLGIMGKKKDIRYHASKESVAELAALQKEILTVVKDYLKSGGTLVYSTCTMCRQENENNVDWFLKENQDFTLKSMRQIFPHEVGNDGFFLAVLEKQ